ncbi:hypothetical protein [Achromobacter aloeverae]
MLELQISHTVADSHGRAYNRTAFLDDRIAFMQWWADYLDQLRREAAARVPGEWWQKAVGPWETVDLEVIHIRINDLQKKSSHKNHTICHDLGFETLTHFLIISPNPWTALCWRFPALFGK